MKEIVETMKIAFYFALLFALSGCGNGTSDLSVAENDASVLTMGNAQPGLVTVNTAASPIISSPGLPELAAASVTPDNADIKPDEQSTVKPLELQQSMVDETPPEVAPVIQSVDVAPSEAIDEFVVTPVQSERPVPGAAPEATPENALAATSQTAPETTSLSALEAISQSPPEATPASLAVNEESVADNVVVSLENRNTVLVGPNPGDAQCLNFGTEAKAFGSVSDNDWRNWMPGFRFAIGEEFLSVEIDEDGKSMLRQKYVPWERGTERVVMGADLPEYDTFRVTESVFFEPGWEWGGDTFEGGKLGFGFGGGAAPSGGIVDPAGFTARIMWRGNYLGGGEYDGTGRLAVYSYAADRPENIGEDIFFNNYIVPIGEWIQITYEVKLNSSINTSDGHVRAWVNGELQVDNKGMGWQLAGNQPVVDTLYYSSFYGGSNPGWAPSKTTYAKVKDVCWAPVVDGYSGIKPDDGILYVDPAANSGSVLDDGAALPRWAELQNEVVRLVDEAKIWLQISAPSANTSAQVHYADAIADLDTSRFAAEQVHETSLGLNPIVGVAGALYDLDLALARNTVSQFELDDSVRTKERLQAALVATGELAIEVVQNYQQLTGCDDTSTAMTCFESQALLDEVRGLQSQVVAASGNDWQEAARFAEAAWNRSVDAIKIIN